MNSGTFNIIIGVAATPQENPLRVTATVDTGATHTMLPASLLYRLGVQSTNSETFRLANGQPMTSPTGMAHISIGDTNWPCPVIFGPEDQYLLGATTLQNFSLVVDPTNNTLIPRGKRSPAAPPPPPPDPSAPPPGYVPTRRRRPAPRGNPNIPPGHHKPPRTQPDPAETAAASQNPTAPPRKTQRSNPFRSFDWRRLKDPGRLAQDMRRNLDWKRTGMDPVTATRSLIALAAVIGMFLPWITLDGASSPMNGAQLAAHSFNSPERTAMASISITAALALLFIPPLMAVLLGISLVNTLRGQLPLGTQLSAALLPLGIMLLCRPITSTDHPAIAGFFLLPHFGTTLIMLTQGYLFGHGLLLKDQGSRNS